MVQIVRVKACHALFHDVVPRLRQASTYEVSLLKILHHFLAYFWLLSQNVDGIINTQPNGVAGECHSGQRKDRARSQSHIWLMPAAWRARQQLRRSKTCSAGRELKTRGALGMNCDTILVNLTLFERNLMHRLPRKSNSFSSTGHRTTVHWSDDPVRIVRLFQQITTCSRSLCSHLVQSTLVRDSEHPIVRRCGLRRVELRVCGARPFCKPHKLFTSLFARQLLLLASKVFRSKTHS